MVLNSIKLSFKFSARWLFLTIHKGMGNSKIFSNLTFSYIFISSTNIFSRNFMRNFSSGTIQNPNVRLLVRSFTPDIYEHLYLVDISHPDVFIEPYRNKTHLWVVEYRTQAYPPFKIDVLKFIVLKKNAFRDVPSHELHLYTKVYVNMDNIPFYALPCNLIPYPYYSWTHFWFREPDYSAFYVVPQHLASFYGQGNLKKKK